MFAIFTLPPPTPTPVSLCHAFARSPARVSSIGALPTRQTTHNFKLPSTCVCVCVFSVFTLSLYTPFYSYFPSFDVTLCLLVFSIATPGLHMTHEKKERAHTFLCHCCALQYSNSAEIQYNNRHVCMLRFIERRSESEKRLGWYRKYDPGFCRFYALFATHPVQPLFFFLSLFAHRLFARSSIRFDLLCKRSSPLISFLFIFAFHSSLCNRSPFMSHLLTFPIERLFQWTTATVTISLGNVIRRRCRLLLCLVWDAIPLSTWSIFDHFPSTLWWSHSFFTAHTLTLGT